MASAACFPVIAGIVVDTLLVGADAAITRAAVMGILFTWAVYLGRRSPIAVAVTNRV